MFEKIGIIDDNEISQKFLHNILSKIEIEENISLSISKFLSPIEYIEHTGEFDILILDSLFRSCCLSLNSISLAKIAKSRNNNTTIILISEHVFENFLKILDNKVIDYYISKRIKEDKIKNFLKSIVRGIKDFKESIPQT